MIRYACPHCGETLESPAELASQDLQCPACHGRTIVPARVAHRVQAPRVSITGVTVPILISAIANILVGMLWIIWTLGCAIPISIALWILCIFEFMLYARAYRLPPAQLAKQAKTLGILEIIVGLVNTAALICGIIVLINASKLRTPMRPAGIGAIP